MAFQQVGVAGISPINTDPYRNISQDVMRGYQMGIAPQQAQQQMQSQDLANRIRQSQLQAMPQQQQQAQAMNQAKMALMNAQAQRAGQVAPSNFDRELDAAVKSGAIHPADAKRAKIEHLRNQLMAKSGLQVSYDEQGRPTMSMGGPSQSPFRFSTDPQQAPAQDQQGLIRGMISGGRGTQGSTFVGPKGEAYSLPSPSQVTDIQQQNRAIQQALSGLDDLKKFTYTKGFGWTHPDNKANYSQSLALAKDKVLRAQGLRPTDKTIETMDEAFSRKVNESESNYDARIEKEAAKLRDIYSSNNQLLTRGMKVRGKDTQGQDSNVSMPEFSDKQEFNSWYSSLSPEKKRQARIQLGGK